MKQVDVLLAVKALVAGAVPGAQIRGFDEDTSAPEVIGDGGAILGLPGDPGEPEVDLSPLSYTYDYEIALEVAAPGGAPGEVLIAMLSAIGAAVLADRTLGGLADWLATTAPRFEDRSTDYDTPNWAEVSLIATYSTSDPLA